MTEPDEPIKTVEIYRGVGLHDHQGPERLALVRSEIDVVFELQGSVGDLFEWVKWRPHSPESRLLAGALIRATCEQASERRRGAPPVDLKLLDAHLVGLDSVQGRSRWEFDTRYRTRDAPGSANRPIRRPQPLDAPATMRRMLPDDP